MATTDQELKDEAALFSDSAAVLDPDELDTVLGRAKSHIRAKIGVSRDQDFDWYGSDPGENSVFWYTCLFSKVATGELDSQAVQVGAIDLNELSADETLWAQKARNAVRNIDVGDYPHGVGISAPTREERVYGSDETGSGTGVEDLS